MVWGVSHGKQHNQNGKEVKTKGREGRLPLAILSLGVGFIRVENVSKLEQAIVIEAM